jgi:uncharacterized protein YnzC (UPF0291/DUF896 family)
LELSKKERKLLNGSSFESVKASVYGHRFAVVRVIDKHGQPVTNITTAEIRAEINDNPH